MTLSGHGAGHPLLRARRPAARLRDGRRGPAARLRRPAGSATSRRSGTTRARAQFYEELARTHRVVRYDRVGAGLSDRELDGPPTVEAETRQLARRDRRVRRRAGDVFACSCAGLATAALRERAARARARKIVFFGGYASRDDIPDATRRSLVDFVRVNWQLAAQMLAGPLRPARRAATRSRRSAASSAAPPRRTSPPPSSSSTSTADARAFLPRVTVPALVLHRRGDRTVPIGRGRELASLLPNARFVPLERRLAPAVDGRPARAAARARRLPRRRRRRASRTATRR